MDQPDVKFISSSLNKVLNYGSQLSAALHDHSIDAGGRAHNGFDAQIIIIDATNSTLRQVVELVKKELGGKKTFSDKGLEYVDTLAIECAAELVKIPSIFADGVLSRKEWEAKKKAAKKASGVGKKGKGKMKAVEEKVEKAFVVETDLPSELDRTQLLENIENAKWFAVKPLLKKCMERLYDVQTHMLLVSQVLTLDSLTKDMSSNPANLKSIVNYHKRIERTADLLYLRLPSKYNNDSDSSDVDSIRFYSSSSDSEVSSIASFRPKKKKRPFFSQPPPPPPANRDLPPPCGPGPPPMSTNTEGPSPPTTDNANPPSYSESPTASSMASDVKSPYPDEKKEVKKEEIEEEEKKEEPKPTEPEARLFNSKSNGLKFKIKSLFRSNQSLAEEMKKVLEDTDSYLSAWVIRNNDFRSVPHSAFHSLEATHMRTILSQLNNNDWYKTFTGLSFMENSSLDRIIQPSITANKDQCREIIVLKVVQQNRQAAWMALLRDVLKRYPSPPGVNGRVLLAIVREKLVDGKPESTRVGLPPPPPPANWLDKTVPPIIPVMRPPPAIAQPVKASRISDLSNPYIPQPPNPPIFMGGPPPPHMRCGPPPPPAPWGNGLPPPPPPPAANRNTNSNSPNPQALIKSETVRIIDTTPLTETDAITALSTFSTYTLRLTEPLAPSQPRSWSRVAVTQESAPAHIVSRRVAAFERSGGDVIAIKLRLTEQQSSQVTRLLDDVRLAERDSRFEWTCVEISGHNGDAEIDSNGNGDDDGWNTATVLHLTLKRTPKLSQRPMELYNNLMNRPIPWNRPPGGMPPPPRMNFVPRPNRRRRGSISDSSSGSDSSSNSDSDSGSESDSSSSGYSSSSSIGDLRMKLRRKKSRAVKAGIKEAKQKEEKEEKRRKRLEKMQKMNADDSEEEVVVVVRKKEKEEKEKVEKVADKIEIKLDLKRGDDVVKALLGLWTVQK